MIARRVSCASLEAQQPTPMSSSLYMRGAGGGESGGARVCACDLDHGLEMTCVKSLPANPSHVLSHGVHDMLSNAAHVVCHVVLSSPYVPRFSRSRSRKRQNFGMAEGQITMMKQNKVPAMVDVQARFAGEGPDAPTTSSSSDHLLLLL
jgi:hypothetical protein